jgi:formate-dependent nitrite reductase cytochrome c552 subunit
MPDRPALITKILLAAIVAAALPIAGGMRAQSSPTPPARGTAQDRVEVPPPPFSDGIFPCSACHANVPANRKRRTLSDMHTEIVLKHDEEHRWCLDCHDADDRDQLHLASGEKVPFSESYRVCGQCHGEKLRDWRAGVHGRRAGNWNGAKTYLLCAHCHNPHQPRFAAIQPKPAPARPSRDAGRGNGKSADGK